MLFPLSRPVNLLVIHHSGGPRTQTPHAIRDYHTRSRILGGKGWGDIGYHWLIDHRGTLVPGRDPHEPGMHVAGHNTHTLGLCVIGNNTVPEEAWTGIQKAALLAFVASFRIFYPKAGLGGHCDLADKPTECPGLDIRAWLRAEGGIV